MKMDKNTACIQAISSQHGLIVKPAIANQYLSDTTTLSGLVGRYYAVYLCHAHLSLLGVFLWYAVIESGLNINTIV